MSGSMMMAAFLVLGAGLWLAVRLVGQPSDEPMTQLGLKIGLREFVTRTMWVMVVVLAAVPAYLGLAEQPAYLKMLVPMLAGIAGAEMVLGRWEERQQRKRQEREIARRQARRAARKQGQTRD